MNKKRKQIIRIFSNRRVKKNNREGNIIDIIKENFTLLYLHFLKKVRVCTCNSSECNPFYGVLCRMRYWAVKYNVIIVLNVTLRMRVLCPV